MRMAIVLVLAWDIAPIAPRILLLGHAALGWGFRKLDADRLDRLLGGSRRHHPAPSLIASPLRKKGILIRFVHQQGHS